MKSPTVGIYIVEDGRAIDRPRTVVLATDATSAVQTVANLYDQPDDDRWNVGRIGTYDPGIQGAAFLVDGTLPANIVTTDGKGDYPGVKTFS